MATSTDGSPRRDLLIALNACLDLRRETVCRLATDPSRWLDAGDCRYRRVSAQQLARARQVASGARVVARSEKALAERVKARIITRLDRDFPAPLLDLELPPPVLYVRGAIPRCPAVAIVGSRQADPYGLEAGELFARSLAAVGLTVVSGLARGVDAAAHRGALAAVGGTTVAVLGRGIDRIYPRRNTQLGERIASSGAVVSEFPVGAAPLPQNFPVRNRIIAALSEAVLVIQAAPRSGSLITARLALDLGRDVFAVPGSIFHRRATGTNALLADGALLAQRPRDVLEALPIAVQDRLVAVPDRRPSSFPEGEAGEVAKALAAHQSLSPEELSRMLAKPIEQVLETLLELELSGQVRRYPGPTFHLRRRSPQ